MKKKLHSLWLNASVKGFVVIALITAMLLTTVSVVFADVTSHDDVVVGETHWTTDVTETSSENGVAPFIDEGATWFYRTNPAAGDDCDGINTNGCEWMYGYGYGVASYGSPAQYGYGFGYGYDYIDDGGYSWTLDDNAIQMGVFMGDEGIFTLPMDDDGVSSPLPDEMDLGGEMEGVSVALPAGLVLTDPSGLWDGTLTVSGSDEPSDLGGFDSGVFVTVYTGVDGDIYLSDAVVVTIPLGRGFDSVNDIVKVSLGGTTYTLDACSEDQYTGDFEGADQLADPTNYDLAAGSEDAAEACYIAYGDYVYVATNHFSEFGAGEEDTGGGSGGGGGSSHKTPEAEAASAIANFVDLASLTTANWEYDVVAKALELGLFHGELNNLGEPVFNMYNNMNRAQAAMVISNYIKCTDTTLTVAPFADVALDVWYAEPIACLKANGIVSGKTPTTFDPAGNVTRMEFFKMAVNGYLYMNPEMAGAFGLLMGMPTTYFTDVKPTDWFYGYTNLAVQLSLLNGYVENGLHVLKPNQAIYRVEGAAMMVRLVAP